MKKSGAGVNYSLLPWRVCLVASTKYIYCHIPEAEPTSQLTPEPDKF